MLTQSKLKETLHYNPLTGIFTRIKKTSHTTKVGELVGGIHKGTGYIRMSILDKKQYGHRLAWLYIYGYIPMSIDHINHDRADNRIANLREVNQQKNMKNASLSNDNTSGITGVYWDKSRHRWFSSIGIDGGNIYLGRFAEFHEAVNARKNAEVLYGFHENHGKDLS